eukprot:11295334-Alexandrium_andersonii.AAC.1
MRSREALPARAGAAQRRGRLPGAAQLPKSHAHGQVTAGRGPQATDCRHGHAIQGGASCEGGISCIGAVQHIGA